jgi:SnoaL-like domain
MEEASARLTPAELEEMRRLATMGYTPKWGAIGEEREADPVVPFRRSDIAEYQRALLRAIEEVGRCYEERPAESSSARRGDAAWTRPVHREAVSDWLERYVAAWKSGKRGEIEALFSEDAQYRYHSYDEPVVGQAAIADSWLDDPDEPGRFDASYGCFAADGDAAVAIGTSTYFNADGGVDRVYDNVFVLRFERSGRCAEFTEWYAKRP